VFLKPQRFSYNHSEWDEGDSPKFKSQSSKIPSFLDLASRRQKCALAKLQKVLGLAKPQHSKKLDALPGTHLYIQSTTLAAACVGNWHTA